MSISSHSDTGPTLDGSEDAHRRFRPAVPFDEAVRLCTYRLATDPHNVALLLQRARAYMHLDDPRAALSDLATCHRVLDAHGASAAQRVDVLYYSGRCHDQLGDDVPAMDYFTAALELDPRCRRAAYGRAACRNRQGDFAGAIEDYERAFACDELASDGTGRARGLSPALLSSSVHAQVLSHSSSLSSEQSNHAYVKGNSSGARSLFALARQRGGQPPAYVAQLQQRSQLRAAAVDAAQPVSGEVSRSTSPGSSSHGSRRRSITMPPNNDAAAAAVFNEARRCGGAEPQTEWAEGGVAGMGAMDPASLTSLTTSFYSLSDLSDEDGDDQTGAVGGSDLGATDGPAHGDGSHSAGYYLQRGLQLRKRGELWRAIHMYTKALEVDPLHFKALFNRAFCYDRVGQLNAAVEDYRAAAEVDPSNGYTFYNLGITYDRLGDLESAVEAFTKAIERDRGRNADFYHNRGFSLRKMGNFRAAIDDYDRAIAINPMHFKSRFNRGYCYDRLGKYERAVDDYTAALRIDPTNVNALHNRGVAYEKLGRLPEALGDFNSALLADRASGYTYNARGLVHDQMKHYAAALADFTEAIRLQPHNAAFLYNRGYTHRGMGQLEDAVTDYTAAIALDQHNIAAYNSRAFVYRKLERYADAIRDYTIVVEKQTAADGSDAALGSVSRSPALDAEARAKTLNNRAYCYARLEQYADAVRDYTTALALDPANAHALHNRAISFDKSGDLYAAIEDLTQLIEVSTKTGTRQGAATASSAYLSRGSAWARLGRNTHAARDFNQALALDLGPAHAKEDPVAREAAMAAHPARQALQRLKEQKSKGARATPREVAESL